MLALPARVRSKTSFGSTASPLPRGIGLSSWTGVERRLEPSAWVWRRDGQGVERVWGSVQFAPRPEVRQTDGMQVEMAQVLVVS